MEPHRIANDKSDVFLTLASFEVWIDTSLAEWLETKINEKTTRGKLSGIMGKVKPVQLISYVAPRLRVIGCL